MLPDLPTGLHKVAQRSAHRGLRLTCHEIDQLPDLRIERVLW